MGKAAEHSFTKSMCCQARHIQLVVSQCAWHCWLLQLQAVRLSLYQSQEGRIDMGCYAAILVLALPIFMSNLIIRHSSDTKSRDSRGSLICDPSLAEAAFAGFHPRGTP